MARRMLEEAMRSSTGATHGGEVLNTYNKVNILKDIQLERELGAVFSLQYNFDCTKVCVGFSGGGVKMFNPDTGAHISELRANRHGGFATMCLRFHPKNPKMLYAATAEGNVYLIDTENATESSNNQPIITEQQNQINAMDFSVDGYNYCTCGKDLNVRVYDTKTNKLFKVYEGYGANVMARGNQDVEAGNTMRVYALKFRPDNENIFLTAGWDNHIKIWDIRTNEGIRRQIHGPHVCGDALDIKDRQILSGSWRASHALQEWDYGEGKIIRDIKFPHKKGAFLYCAQYADLGCVLAGGSGTSSVEVMEAKNDRVVGSVKLDGAVQALDSGYGGRYFAVGGQDSRLKLCSTT